jgi:RNA recognition motif-containing protein
MRLYVGNLAYSVTGQDLREIFTAYGKVAEAIVLTDRETRRSRGYGFVEMPDLAEARKAIVYLHGITYRDREMQVREAKPKPEPPERYAAKRARALAD